MKFNVGDFVHVNRDDPQWGRIAYDGKVAEVHSRHLLVDIPYLRANVACKRSECNLRNFIVVDEDGIKFWVKDVRIDRRLKPEYYDEGVAQKEADRLNHAS